MARRGRPRKQKTKSRRRRLGIRKRVRHFGSRIKHRVKKKARTIENIITSIYAPVASIQLLSHNQVSALPTGSGYGMKIKAMVNGVTGSLLDFNVFADAPQAHVHFDIEGVFNQYTAISIGAMIAGFAGKALGVKKASTLTRFGSRTLLPVMISGALGKKNTNPDNSRKHSPYFESRSISTGTISLPQIRVSSGRI